MATTHHPITFERLAELDTPENARKAGRSLEYVLRIGGRGAYGELVTYLDVTRQTVRNWTSGAVAITPQNVHRIADYLGRKYDTDEVGTLFDLLYSDDHLAAAKWLLDSCSTHFLWTA